MTVRPAGILLFILVGLMIFSRATGPDDYLLAKEDRQLRVCENIEERVALMIKVLRRRMLVLEARHLKSGADELEKLRKKNEMLAVVADYTDDRLLSDYTSGLRSILLKIEGQFGSANYKIMGPALRELKKAGGQFMKILQALEPKIGGRADITPLLQRAIALTDKAVTGAERGLKVMGDSR